MLFGVISFGGRLGRLGWLLHMILGAIGALGAFLVAYTLIEEARPRPPVDVQDRIVYVLVAVWILIALSVLGASIRRLRDGGGKLPYAELLFSLMIPVLGWLWLLYRLLIDGRQAVTPAVEADAQGVWTKAASPARPAEVPDVPSQPVQPVRTAAALPVRETTVTRLHRGQARGARRIVGF